ncbi:MAG: metallophosphoesterase, partial [Planctomycetota bacterium]
MRVALLLLILVGHGLIWTGVVNRLHGYGMPRRLVKWLTLGCFVLLLAIPLSVVFSPATFGLIWAPWDRLTELIRRPVIAIALGYMGVCMAVTLVSMGLWTYRSAFAAAPRVLRAAHSRVVQLGPGVGPASEERATDFLISVPGNQTLHLDLAERAIELPRLPQALDGLVLVHISDFHFTGRVPKAYFREVVRYANELNPDLVALTGDFVDCPECLPWAAEVLGSLRAPHGVYFVLGNHDHKVDHRRLREDLKARGLIDLGGRWLQTTIRDQSVILAGNEMPWFVPAAELSRCPPRLPDGPVRIVLSHSPDQIDWAQHFDVDLLLAGHTHGGQIRLPWIGALLSPSRAGVRYASGL